MEIKELTSAQDINEIIDIYKTYNPSNEELEEAAKALREDFNEIGNNRVSFIAYDKNVAIGSVQLILKNADNDPDLANGKTIAHIHNLRVRKDAQGKGFGSLLTQHVEKYARDAGFKKITLGVDNWNENAIRFYKNLGYLSLKEAEGRTNDEKVFYLYKII